MHFGLIGIQLVFIFITYVKLLYSIYYNNRYVKLLSGK